MNEPTLHFSSTARLYGQLAPETITSAAAVVPAVPEPADKPPWQTLCDRPQQVVKTLGLLAGMTEVWEAAGALPGLDRYLGARRGAKDLLQYTDYHHALTSAAMILRVGAP